jgi:hypothetical protein
MCALPAVCQVLLNIQPDSVIVRGYPEDLITERYLFGGLVAFYGINF